MGGKGRVGIVTRAGCYYMKLLQRVEQAREREAGLQIAAEDVRRLASMLELGEAYRIAEAYDLDAERDAITRRRAQRRVMAEHC